MHAVVLSEFGPAANLRLGEYPDPAEAPGWVTVRLRASALNWHDVLVRQGRYGSPLPHVLGADGAGVLEGSGDEVILLPSLWWGEDERAPAPGWEILGDYRPGTYAERVRVPVDCVASRPVGFSWAEAAALPLAGVTAFRALFTRGGISAGESILVLGAGGGVATSAVALAAAAGASVIVTSSSAAKIEQARSLGAHDGVRYDHPDWPIGARELSPGGRGFDVVLDSVGDWSKSILALRPGGRLLVLGATRATTATLDVRSLYFGQYDIRGTTMGSLRDFADLLAFVRARRVPPPVIDRTFPLDKAAAAHEHLESGQAFGKVVLIHD
jgi:zinc-binding alcohol dehydrogenase/oxidoreductase